MCLTERQSFHNKDKLYEGHDYSPASITVLLQNYKPLLRGVNYLKDARLNQLFEKRVADKLHCKTQLK